MQLSRILTLALLIAAAASAQDAGGYRRIPAAELRNKIEGGWAGQMIGVSFGAPTEFRALSRINEGELPKWTPGRVSNSLDQDDLYVDMTFAKVLDDKGLNATSEDFGNMFRNARYHLWHANLAARRNLRRGIPATESGTPKYNAHADDIDFQIESDFIGLMSPALYQSATDIAWRAGRVMNYGDGIYGGIFVSCMYSAAFVETDPRRVVETGLACLPPQSPYARLIADVLQWSKQYPGDWKKVWQLLEDKWDKDDVCPEGALRPFNIDAKLNGAYIALGLLHGGRDFGKSIEIATRSGQDSDCNPASTGGILGVMLGYKAIPEQWKSGIPAIADKKFSYTDFSFHTIVDSSYRQSLQLIQKTGGRMESNMVLVKTQKATPAKFESWNPGRPVERIASSDARWQWKGSWQVQPPPPGDKRGRSEVRFTSSKGAEASVSFEGKGAIVTGPYLPDGGKLDVYLDGKLDRTVDVYADEDKIRAGEAVWHAFGLKSGKHTVRLLVRGEPYTESSGSKVSIQDLVVFR